MKHLTIVIDGKPNKYEVKDDIEEELLMESLQIEGKQIDEVFYEE